ncbi:hypothetical protein ACNFR7_03305 [Streptomyces sp. RM1]
MRTRGKAAGASASSGACGDRGGPGRRIVLPRGLAGHAGEWDGLD